MQLILVDNCDVHFCAFTPPEYENYKGKDEDHPFNYGTTEEVSIRPGTCEKTGTSDGYRWSWWHKSNGNFYWYRPALEVPSAARRLTSEIMSSKVGRTSTLNLYLANIRPFHYDFNLTIKCESGFNILRELRKRFRDNVKISVCMKCTTDKRQCSKYGVPTGAGILDVELGKEINADYTCNLGKVHANHLIALKMMSVCVQVVAHIPDYVFNPKVPTDSAESRNRKILNEGLFSDVIITAENGEEIKAHRAFLVASSSVFKTMFETGLEESKTGTIDMSDMSEHGVRAFLRYLYFNDTVGPDVDIGLAFELLYAAHKYDVQALEAAMIENLLLARKEEDFGTEWAFEIYMFVRCLKSACALEEKLIGILKKNLHELRTLPEYAEFCEKNPREAKELRKALRK